MFSLHDDIIWNLVLLFCIFICMYWWPLESMECFLVDTEIKGISPVFHFSLYGIFCSYRVTKTFYTSILSWKGKHLNTFFFLDFSANFNLLAFQSGGLVSTIVSGIVSDLLVKKVRWFLYDCMCMIQMISQYCYVWKKIFIRNPHLIDQTCLCQNHMLLLEFWSTVHYFSASSFVNIISRVDCQNMLQFPKSISFYFLSTLVPIEDVGNTSFVGCVVLSNYHLILVLSFAFQQSLHFHGRLFLQEIS